MRNFTIFLAILIFVSSYGKNRSVIASAGKDFSSNDFHYSWTLGESVIGTLNNGTTFLTQGFHQPRMKAEEVVVNIEFDNHLEFSAYPIPTYGKTYFKITSLKREKFDVTIKIFNLQGKLVHTVRTDKEENIVNLVNVYPGTYVVNFINSSSKSLIETIRIIKL
jgi:hypothetical protein